MGGAHGLLLREMDSHIFHGSGAALAGVLRAAHFRSACLIAIVVGTELGRAVWPGSGLPRCAPGPVVSSAAASSSSHAVHRTAMRTDVCVSVRLCVCCRRVRNAEPGSLKQPASQVQLLGRHKAAYGVRSSSRGGGSGGCCSAGCCWVGVSGAMRGGELWRA